MEKIALRIILTIAALGAAVAGYISGQTWLYMVAVMIVLIGVAFVAKSRSK